MPRRLALALLPLLAACAPAAPPPAPGSPEAACLAAVQAVTNNPEQSVVTVDAGNAGTRVVIGVGPDRALWQCMAQPDGTTTGVMSLTDEGAL
jgi:hypothetical protein